MKVLAAFFKGGIKMKNEFQKHKKSDSVKWGIAFTLIAILLITAVLGILQAFTDFKPSEWFTGINEGTPSSEETPVCEHIFKYGICTECGERATQVIQLATKVVSPDEKCTINFYTADYHLIESKEVKGGDPLTFLEGYDDYAMLLPTSIVVPSFDNVKPDDVLIDGKFYSMADYENIDYTAASLYPYFVEENLLQYNLINRFYGYYNSDLIIADDYNYNEFFQGDYIKVKPMDSFEFINAFDSAGMYFVADGFLFAHVTAPISEIDIQCSLDYINFVVLDYDNSEVA